MKIFKSVLILSALAAFTACGSSSTSTPVGVNPYASNPVYSNNGYGTQTGYGTIAVPGGTKTVTNVLGGALSPQVSTTGTRVYSIAGSVNAGDQIIVSANGSMMTAYGSILGGFGTTSSSGYLTQLTVSVNGQTLGSSLTATYTVPASGTLTIEGQSNAINIARTANTTYTTYFVGGVTIAHCVNTAGVAMPCPAGY